MTPLSWLQRALRVRPRRTQEPEAQFQSALLSVLEGDLSAAEQSLTELVRTDSNSVAGYMALACLYRRRGDIGRAIRIHQNLLLRAELSPEDRLAALEGLAADFRRGGFLRRAIEAYEELLEINPKHPVALHALSGLLEQAGDFVRARRCLKQLGRVEGRSSREEEARLLAGMAQSAREEGKLSEAGRRIRKALRKDKHCSPAWFEKGEIEVARGRVPAALASWQEAVEIDRSLGSLVYSRVVELVPPESYEIFLREVLERCPDDATATLALAELLLKRSAVQEVILELRKRLEHRPRDLRLVGKLGRLLLEEGRETEACEEFRSLLRLLEKEGLLRPLETIR